MQEETTRSLQKIERGELTFFFPRGRPQSDGPVVCYAIRLRLVEFGDRPEILEQMAKRSLADSDDKGQGGGAAHDE